jgi:hypothetical protein
VAISEVAEPASTHLLLPQGYLIIPPYVQLTPGTDIYPFASKKIASYVLYISYLYPHFTLEKILSVEKVTNKKQSKTTKLQNKTT